MKADKFLRKGICLFFLSEKEKRLDIPRNSCDYDALIR